MELKRHECVNKDTFKILQDIEVEQQFDDYGNHRLVVGDFYSRWHAYQGFAIIDMPAHDLRIMGTSPTWAGTFPRVFYCEDAAQQFGEDFNNPSHRPE